MNKKQPWVTAQVARLQRWQDAPLPWPIVWPAIHILLAIAILVIAYDMPIWLATTLVFLVLTLCFGLVAAGLVAMIVQVTHGTN